VAGTHTRQSVCNTGPLSICSTFKSWQHASINRGSILLYNYELVAGASIVYHSFSRMRRTAQKMLTFLYHMCLYNCHITIARPLINATRNIDYSTRLSVRSWRPHIKITKHWCRKYFAVVCPIILVFWRLNRCYEIRTDFRFSAIWSYVCPYPVQCKCKKMQIDWDYFIVRSKAINYLPPFSLI